MCACDHDHDGDSGGGNYDHADYDDNDDNYRVLSVMTGAWSRSVVTAPSVNSCVKSSWLSELGSCNVVMPLHHVSVPALLLKPG